MTDSQGELRRLLPSHSDQRLLVLSAVLADISALRAPLSMLVEAIASSLDVPIVLVSLVDVEVEHVLAHTGLSTSTSPSFPISRSFCRLVVAAGEVQTVSSTVEDPRTAGNPTVEDLGAAAYLGHPLRVNSHVLGSLCAIDHHPRDWSAQEARSLRRFADLVEYMITERLRSQTALVDERASASAMERSQEDRIDAFRSRTEEQDRIQELSRRFQRALMPRSTAPEGIEVDVLYEPGSERLLVGGDFADTMLGGDQDQTLNFVLGDVTGHGPEAAALAISLRASWNALQAVGIGLPGIAAELNLQAVSSGLLATVLLGVLQDDVLSVLSAGHPLPILADAAGARELDAPAGLLLGLKTPAAPWQVTRHQIRGETILAYTDGLIEGFIDGTRQRLGLERLIAIIDRHGTDPARLSQIATQRNRGPLADDVAILRIQPS